MKCITCPANQIANTYQSVSTACQCSIGYSPSGNGGCSAITGSCGLSANTYYPLYDLNGNTKSVSSCGVCASTAFTNRYAKNNLALFGCYPSTYKELLEYDYTNDYEIEI